MEGITSTAEIEKKKKKGDNDADAICDFYDLRLGREPVACASNDICKILRGISGDGKKSGGSSGLSLIHARNLCGGEEDGGKTPFPTKRKRFRL